MKFMTALSSKAPALLKVHIFAPMSRYFELVLNIF